MSKRIASRGYSILAALVFVAALSSIVALVNVLDGGGDSIAMTASAPVAALTPSGAPAPATSPAKQDAGTKQQCNPGYDYTVSRKSTGAPQVASEPVCPPPGDQPKGPEKIQQVVPAAAVLALGPGTFGQKNDPARCELDPKTKQYKPKSDYKCKVKYCLNSDGGSGGKCIEVDSPFDAKSSIDPSAIDKQQREAAIKAALRDTNPTEHQKLLKELGISSADQDILKKVYEEQKTELQTQIQKNQNQLDQLRQYIDSCSDCDPNDPTLKKVQADAAALEQKQKELQARMEALKNAEKATLTPPQTPPIQNPPMPPRDPRKPPVDQQTFPGPGGTQQQPGGSNPLGALGSLLQGLAKGLGGSGSGSGAPCSSDPNTYQQQQQQYQMQLQQYNYQLQQYNYQQDRAYYYGGVLPEAPVAPQACTPNSNSNTCPAAPPQPTTTCNGSWKPVTTQQSNGRQCTTSWQCVPSNTTPPTAEMSCQPKVADVGSSVAISFSCGNATGSTGSGTGFSTDNETSGSRSVVIENPPAGATGITYGLTCRNGNLTARAECAVQIARPTIVLVANPRAVESGETSRIGWVTSGMQSCVVSSPQMPGFTLQNAEKKNVNGVATTSPITRDTTVVLTCDTIGGSVKAASTTITVGNSTSTSSMEVTSSIDGNSSVHHGDAATITWSAPAAPSNSAVALWLIDELSGQATGLIARSLGTSGTYDWGIPSATSSCPIDTPIVCGADMVNGRLYSIQASLYSPPDAYLGGYPPANPITPTYLDEDFTQNFKMAD